ncbi:hypothetical protein [Streptomyces sp. NPDC005485]|uniref:hypothetical protein n=1 Tax=Streptomyces sp. NPDC005485 TaxID=3155591 RepID=UPI0033BA3D85
MTDTFHHLVPATAHAQVRAVAERVVQELALTADKVAVHHAEPARYPLPADESAAEHLIARRFEGLSEEEKRRAAARALADLNGGPGRAARLGDLARVDLRSPASVDAQAKRLGFPDRLRFPVDHLRKLPASLLPEESAPVTGEGDGWVYEPLRRFHWFGLDEVAEYPRTYFVTLVLADIEWPGLAEYVHQLLDLVRRRVLGGLSAAVGEPVGTASVRVGMTVGAAVGWVLDRLKELYGDEVFRPVTVGTVLPAPPAHHGAGPCSPVVDQGCGGHCRQTYDWRVFDRVPGRAPGRAPDRVPG